MKVTVSMHSPVKPRIVVPIHTLSGSHAMVVAGQIAKQMAPLRNTAMKTSRTQCVCHTATVMRDSRGLDLKLILANLAPEQPALAAITKNGLIANMNVDNIVIWTLAVVMMTARAHLDVNANRVSSETVKVG